MITRGIPIGRVLGCEIRVHFSWLILLVFLAASLGAAGLPARYPSWPAPLAWAVATASALALFLGVLLHEIAHIVVARRCGVPAVPVTLLLFGAPSTLEDGAASPRAEAAIALAGPVVSLTIGFLSVGAAVALAGPVASTATGNGAGLAVAAGEVLLTAGVLNGLIGLMNLLPVFPLDGARLLRAVAWKVTGDPRRGARAAVKSGQFVGIGIVLLGLFVTIRADPVDGLVLIFLGWFVRNASAALSRREDLEGALAGKLVEEAMERDLPGIPPQVTLDTFASLLIGPGHVTVLPVVGPDGEPVGLIGHTALRKAGKKAWPRLHVRDVMTPRETLPSVRPGDELREAIGVLQASRADGIPVLDEAGATVGILTRHGVGRLLRERVPGRGGFLGG